MIAEEFLRHGYLKIGIDHFARPGDLVGACRRIGAAAPQFPGYTDDASVTLIGLGAVRFPGSRTDTFRIFPTFRATSVPFRAAISRRRAAVAWTLPGNSAPVPSKA